MMIKSKAHAKLNLNLHIIPRRKSDGLYPVQFINTQLELHDELQFESSENQNDEIVWKSEHRLKTEENLIYKSIQALRTATGYGGKGVKITVDKHIPVTAGFGGGSSDAGTTLITLNTLWKRDLSLRQLNTIADKLGKDIPYFLTGGLCHVSGSGERVSRLELQLPKLWLVIIVPDQKKPSTEWMYQNLDVTTAGKNVHKIDKLKEALAAQNTGDILNNLHNDFEPVIISHFPEVQSVYDSLLNSNAERALMAGAGLSITGFYLSEDAADSALLSLKKRYNSVIKTTFL